MILSRTTPPGYEILKQRFEDYGSESRFEIVDRLGFTFSQSHFNECIVNIPNSDSGLLFYKWLWYNFSPFFNLKYYTILYKYCLTRLIQFTEKELLIDHITFICQCREEVIYSQVTTENVVQYVHFLFETGRIIILKPEVLIGLLARLLAANHQDRLVKILLQSVMLRNENAWGNYKECIESLVKFCVRSKAKISEQLFKMMTEIGLLGIRAWSCLSDPTPGLPKSVWENLDSYMETQTSNEDRAIRLIIDITNPDYLQIAGDGAVEKAFDVLIATKEKFPNAFKTFFPMILRRQVGIPGITDSESDRLTVKLLNDTRSWPEFLIVDITHLLLFRGSTSVLTAYHRIMEGEVYTAIVRATFNNMIQRTGVTDGRFGEEQKSTIIKLFGGCLKLDADFTWKYLESAGLEALADEILSRCSSGKTTDGILEVGDRCIADLLTKCKQSNEVEIIFKKYQQLLGPKSLGTLMKSLWKWDISIPMLRLREHASEHLEDFVEGVIRTFMGLHFDSMVQQRKDTRDMIVRCGSSGDRLIMGSVMYERMWGKTETLLTVSDKVCFTWTCESCGKIKNQDDHIYKNPKSKHGGYLCIGCTNLSSDDPVECIICLSTEFATHGMIILPCGHACCGPCLQALVKDRESSARCPMCRKSIETIMKPNKNVVRSIAEIVKEFCEEFRSKPHEEIKEAAARLLLSSEKHD